VLVGGPLQQLTGKGRQVRAVVGCAHGPRQEEPGAGERDGSPSAPPSASGPPRDAKRRFTSALVWPPGQIRRPADA
jgi:hypothetical protein